MAQDIRKADPMAFEQAFKNIDDVLRKEAGCTTELDYTEQTSWLLFLKYLDGLEQDRADEAALDGSEIGLVLKSCTIPLRGRFLPLPRGDRRGVAGGKVYRVATPGPPT